MSTEHPDLAAMVRGDLGNAHALDAAAHARGCRTCRLELVDVAVGHGLLSAAARTLGPVASDDAPELAVPPARARLVGRGSRLGGRRSGDLRLLVAAAAVAVLAGSGVGAWLLAGGGEETPPAAVERTARLEPVAPGSTARGRVTMNPSAASRTRMTVDVAELPQAGPGTFYYVWLLDPETNKMLPLGVVDPDRPTSFEVPESLVGAYAAVDVSLEADDGDPAHSAESVLRATYADPATDS